MMNQSAFEAIGKPIELKKGELIFKQGDLDTSIYIVRSGLLKAYYLTLDGKELVKSFIPEGEFIGSLIACSTNEACTFSLMCLEDCSILRAQFIDLQNASINNPEFSNSVINSLLHLAIKKERREFEFLCLSASERYALFKQRNPELIERITQNDIARYLGITPVALSRIKRQKNRNGNSQKFR